MKVYLDTCILSLIFQQQVPPDQLDALETLSDRSDIELVTSKKMLEEFLRSPDDKTRKSLKVLFKLITKIESPSPTREDPALWGEAVWGTSQWGGGTVTDPLMSNLLLYFDQADAEHLFYAKKAECDYFLTLDYKTIINPYLKQKTSIDAFIRPLEIGDPQSVK